MPQRPLPPKPTPRADRVSPLRYLRLFRRDLLSAQPARLYRAWMAEFRTPFFRSFLVNQPDLVRLVLQERPGDFPKSDRIREGLAPLLGQSVFVTNGEVWERQRRIIDPSFEGGRLRETFRAMHAAAEAAVARLDVHLSEGSDQEGCAKAGPVGAGGRATRGDASQLSAGGPNRDVSAIEIEEVASFAAADVIFRTLFSVPIDDAMAAKVFAAFRAYQRVQPLVNLAAFVPLPRWVPRGHRRHTRHAARAIRRLMAQLVERRLGEIAAGTAPNDLATKILTTPDPQTGHLFDKEEMIDQVAIFFLAGHETSASALAWGLYLLAAYPDVQQRVAEEARRLPPEPAMSDLADLGYTRDVFREVLRLYPPVPMMVRQATRPERFRDRDVPPGAQIVLSPWHLHRHVRFWEAPDAFAPERWSTPSGKASAREAYLPFSSGPRVCTGAGFAMAEGVLLLSVFARAFEFRVAPEHPAPVPVAHLTVRSRDGIWLRAVPRVDDTCGAKAKEPGAS